MFLTVTLNAAIDKTLRVANLQIGRRHRCAPGDLQAGGKGINVARALRALVSRSSPPDSRAVAAT